MTDNDKVTSLIRIQEATLERLRKRQHPGQSLNGIIEELLNEVEPKKLEDMLPSKQPEKL